MSTLTTYRITLDYTSDPYTKLQSGATGTVYKERYSEYDGTTTIHVKWDDGSSLSLLDSEDRWHEI
jgi:hypothetical protein